MDQWDQRYFFFPSFTLLSPQLEKTLEEFQFSKALTVKYVLNILLVNKVFKRFFCSYWLQTIYKLKWEMHIIDFIKQDQTEKYILNGLTQEKLPFDSIKIHYRFFLLKVPEYGWGD